MILTVTLNPAIDKVLTYPEIRWGQIHRDAEMTAAAGDKGVNTARVAHQMGYPSAAATLLSPG